jgi:hypothetical protein
MGKLHGTGGDLDFIKRAKLIEKSSDYLVEGALVIELKMELSEGSYQSKHYPKPPPRNFMVIRDDEETCDIAFNVKGTVIN